MDFRGHGDTYTSNDEDLSAEIMAKQDDYILILYFDVHVLLVHVLLSGLLWMCQT